jgi:hypothetical protein
MALPSHIAKKFRQHLGDDTGGDLVTWLDEMRAEHGRLLARIEASEVRLIERMDKRFDRIDERFGKVDQDTAGLRVAIADSKADLMKWMFVFWVGAIAALAVVLRQ